MDLQAMDPKQVKMGRADEVQFMVKKLDMFEFGSLDAAMRRGGKKPTTTRWVEGWKEDDAGSRFVRCRLVGRDFKTQGGKEQEELFAAMPPLELARQTDQSHQLQSFPALASLPPPIAI